MGGVVGLWHFATSWIGDLSWRRLLTLPFATLLGLVRGGGIVTRTATMLAICCLARAGSRGEFVVTMAIWGTVAVHDSLQFWGRGHLGGSCSPRGGGMLSDLVLFALPWSHKDEMFFISCNSPKRPIACSMPAPTLFSRIFFANSCILYAVSSIPGSFIGDNETPLPFHAAEIPLPSGVEIGLVAGGFSRDLDVVAEMKAVGGSIGWIQGGFMIGHGRAPLGPNLIPYSLTASFLHSNK